MILEAGIIGQLTGLVGGVATSIVGYLQTKENNKHELEITKLKHEQGIEMHEKTALDTEHDRTITHDSVIKGISSWVRPILTLVSFATAQTIAILMLGSFLPTELTLHQETAMAGMFATANICIGWWFGPRLGQKIMEKCGKV